MTANVSLDFPGVTAYVFLTFSGVTAVVSVGVSGVTAAVSLWGVREGVLVGVIGNRKLVKHDTLFDQKGHTF